jgi:uncharacterized membrane-anchored protein
MRRATAVVCANLVVVLAAANWIILDKEDLKASGHRVLLEIGSRDPRSLLQGDYMALHYRLAFEIAERLEPGARGDGLVVLAVDENDVGSFARFHGGQELAAGEQLLRDRIRSSSWDRVRVAAEEFFFQEDMAEEYDKARYAELRVDADGNSLLIGLCDDDREPLGR